MTTRNIPVDKTFDIAKKQIDNGEFSFFMRNKTQHEYHPKKVGDFTEERYKIAYTLQDMACLCTSPEISNFIVNVVYRLRDGAFNDITEEEMEYVVKFIRSGKNDYKKSEYVDLEDMV